MKVPSSGLLWVPSTPWGRREDGLPVPGSHQGSQTPPGSLCRGRNPESRAWGDGPLEWGPWGDGEALSGTLPLTAQGGGPSPSVSPPVHLGCPLCPKGLHLWICGLFPRMERVAVVRAQEPKPKLIRSFCLPTTLGQCQNSLILVSAGKTRHCFPFVKSLCVSLGFPSGQGCGWAAVCSGTVVCWA